MNSLFFIKNIYLRLESLTNYFFNAIIPDRKKGENVIMGIKKYKLQKYEEKIKNYSALELESEYESLNKIHCNPLDGLLCGTSAFNTIAGTIVMFGNFQLIDIINDLNNNNLLNNDEIIFTAGAFASIIGICGLTAVGIKNNYITNQKKIIKKYMDDSLDKKTNTNENNILVINKNTKKI